MDKVVRVHLLVHLPLNNFHVLLVKSVVFFFNELFEERCKLHHKRVCQVEVVYACFVICYTDHEHGIPHNFERGLGAEIELRCNSRLDGWVSLDLINRRETFRPLLNNGIVHDCRKLLRSVWQRYFKGTEHKLKVIKAFFIQFCPCLNYFKCLLTMVFNF